jgi:hypothetical protein
VAADKASRARKGKAREQEEEQRARQAHGGDGQGQGSHEGSRWLPNWEQGTEARGALGPEEGQTEEPLQVGQALTTKPAPGVSSSPGPLLPASGAIRLSEGLRAGGLSLR